MSTPILIAERVYTHGEGGRRLPKKIEQPLTSREKYYITSENPQNLRERNFFPW